MCRVSVIIPTYNRAAVLGRAVQSVLEQTYTDFELFVVDDGSTDETATVLAAFGDPRLTGIRQENKGVSAARNTGIEASRGEYIALLDSDDFWKPQKLAKQVHFMDESGFALSQTNEEWIRHGKWVNACRKHEKLAGWFLERSLELCLISPSCVLFTRALWAELGPFDENLPACEDYSLWLRVGLRTPAGLLPEALTVKTGGHADQLSRKIIGLDLYRIYAMRDLLLSMELSFSERELVLRALRQRICLYSQGCLKHGKDEEALRMQELLAHVEAGIFVGQKEE